MIEPISRDQLRQLLVEDSVQLVDVLPEAEYRQSHLPGASNLPLRTLTKKTTRALERDKPVAVY